MTEIQLKQLQALPLDIKIEKTKARIREFYYTLGGKVYVSFSGGKDSTVLLHLVRQEFPDVVAIYCDTGLEYPELKDFVKAQRNVEIIKPKLSFLEVIEKVGFPVVSKEVSLMIEYGRKGSEWALNKIEGKNKKGEEDAYRQQYKKYKHLLNAPFRISDKCCAIMKKEPFKRIEKERGIFPFIGTTTEESAMRKNAWLKNGCNAFESKRVSSQPISFWKEQDILKYIKDFNLEVASVYGKLIEDVKGKLSFDGCQRTGCMFCPLGSHLDKKPNRFQRMKETHPQIWEYCMNKIGLKEVLEFLGVERE